MLHTYNYIILVLAVLYVTQLYMHDACHVHVSALTYMEIT